MKRRIVSLFLALLLLSCCACGRQKGPVLYRSATPCEEPSNEGYDVVMTFKRAGDGGQLDVWDWSMAFTGISPLTVDRTANPPRFDGDKSVWMTYIRNGDWDDCVLGRCITTREEWDFMDRVLFSPEYEADPDAQPNIQAPCFILRQGNECTSSTIRKAVDGETFHVDDTVSQYFVSSDGTVIRIDADESVYRAKKQLDRESVAYLYLLYEAYCRTSAVCVLYNTYDVDSYHLLVDWNGQRVEIPHENFDSFAALISEEGNEYSGDLYFDCTSVMYADSDYPSPEVLRFRFVYDGYDPDSSPFLWFSLHQDGKITLECPIRGGYIYNQVLWWATGRNRMISVSSYDVDEIVAFVEANGMKS